MFCISQGSTAKFFRCGGQLQKQESSFFRIPHTKSY